MINVNPNDKNTFKITELWAFVSSDEGGDGLIAEMINGLWMPFVCADKARLNSLLERARAIQKESSKKIKVMHFRLDDVQEDI